MFGCSTGGSACLRCCHRYGNDCVRKLSRNSCSSSLTVRTGPAGKALFTVCWSVYHMDLVIKILLCVQFHGRFAALASALGRRCSAGCQPAPGLASPRREDLQHWSEPAADGSGHPAQTGEFRQPFQHHQLPNPSTALMFAVLFNTWALASGK